MDVKHAKSWFENLPNKPELTEDERQRLLLFVGDERFGLFWGYLNSEIQGYYWQLSNQPLGTAATAAAASVLQGKIHGLARVKDCLIELLADIPTETEKRND